MLKKISLKLKNLKLVKNKMNLTNDEKKIIRFVLKKHLEEVNETEKLLNMDVSFLAAEEKYEMFVEKLIKKLK